MSWLVLIFFQALSLWYQILPRKFHLSLHKVLAFGMSKISFPAVERNLSVINKFRLSKGYGALNKGTVRYQFWCYQLKNIMDFILYLVNGKIGLEQLVVWRQGEEKLRKVYDSGEGIIGICLHIGNWELGGRVLTDKGYQLNSLVFEQLNPALEKVIRRTRKNSKITLLHQRKGLRKGLKKLQEGQLVTVLCDQDGTYAGHFTDFFGLPLSFPRVFELFLSKSRARLLPMIILHNGEGYEIHILDEWTVDRENWDDWLPEFYKNLSRHLEFWIAKYPEQWLLVYDRFKFRHEKKWREEGRLEKIKAHYQDVWKGI